MIFLDLKKKVSIFKGWNNSSVIKLKIHKNGVKNYKDLLKIDKKLHQNEKIIILRKGKIKIHIDKKNFKMSKLDVLNLFSNNREIKITALENSEIFFVYCIKKDQTSGKPKLFNFKKDIKPKNLWGGECISRVYYGKVLNVVMFDLKKDLNFMTTVQNEQITWLLSGQMEFTWIKKLLKVDEGVSIGKVFFMGNFNVIGFDAFFPRRNENRYKN